MSLPAALRALSAAKKEVRRCKEEGRPPPEQSELFARPPAERRRIEAIARRSDYAEPWASYLAPHQLDVTKHLSY
jgi:hypothetical protein